MYYIHNMIPSCSGGGLGIQPSDLISLETVYDNNIHRVQKQCDSKDIQPEPARLNYKQVKYVIV